MKLRTVLDLKVYLNTHTLSPERFSAITGVSNMTIRRWVKNEDAFLIPEKYWPLFDQTLNESTEFPNSFSFQNGFQGLEDHVYAMGKDEEKLYRPKEVLEVEFTEKAKDATIGSALIDKVKTLFRALKAPEISTYQRTLVLGAIIYFLSPIDLIPDATPLIGYLDDYAVATMVLTSVVPVLKKEQTSTQNETKHDQKKQDS